MRRVLIVAAAVAAFAPPARRVAPPVTRAAAAPRWVDGPGDVDEARAVSKHTGNAVCVLYFSAMAGAAHASALATLEFVASAMPGVECLLASKERDGGGFGALDRVGDVPLPCVEVFYGGESRGVSAAGDLPSALAALGLTPAAPGGSSPPTPDVAGDLWSASAESRADPTFKPPPPSNRRAERSAAARNAPEKAPRTTARFAPGFGMGQAPPPGMRDTIKKQEDAEGNGLPPGARVVDGDEYDKRKQKKKPTTPPPNPINELKKTFEQFGKSLGKDTEKVAKEFEKKSEAAAAAARARADDLTRAAGGETSRDKLDRLFSADADATPADEQLSDFEQFLANRAAGNDDAAFYAARETDADVPEAAPESDDAWLDGIAYRPPEK